MKAQKVNYSKWIKLCIAVPLATLIAEVLGLSFAYSAGVITLLTVFDTKQETLLTALKRVAAFGIMIVLCILIFSIAGYNIPAYAVFICIFLLICYRFDLETAISMNVVIATHFLWEQSISISMIGNESLLFIVGAGIGILANLIMPENLHKIREKQRQTDKRLKEILLRMGEYLCREDRSDYTDACFVQVEELLADLKKEALIRTENKMNKSDRYFLKYMHMREGQCETLKDIYSSIIELTGVPVQAYDISQFMGKAGESFHEMNNAKTLMAEIQELEASYKLLNLPESRDEFENRAILFHILRSLRILIGLKRDFVLDLTPEEKAEYWT